MARKPQRPAPKKLVIKKKGKTPYKVVKLKKVKPMKVYANMKSIFKKLGL